MWKIYIKRFFAIFLFIFCLLALGGVIVFSVSMFKEIERLSNDPSASGMDFLLFEPMFISLSAFVGLFCSGVSTKLFTFKTTKIISFVLVLLFGIILLVAFPMWFML